ncbi:hypothetical protein EBX31_14925 [bacterium]|nr:hypothetical protein [bacterium]
MSAAGNLKLEDLPKRAFLGFCKKTFWPRFGLGTFTNWWWGTDWWGVWGFGWSERAEDGGWKHGNTGLIPWRLSVKIARIPKSMKIG